MNLEIALRMCTYGTYIGSLGTNYDVTTVAALPNFNFGFLEHLSGLDILEEGAVALFVTFLDGGDHTELHGESLEAFGLGSLGEAFVHIGPFIVLAGGCFGEVGSSVAYSFELLEPHFCVFFLVVGGLKEKGGYLLVALFLGGGGKVSVFVSCLGLSGECGLEIFLGLGACVLVSHSVENLRISLRKFSFQGGKKQI